LPEGTVGELSLPNGLTLYTIERPWLRNEPFVSCIPCGTYALEWDTTGRVKNVPRLRGTEPRTQINIHVANWARELHGCIAPGLGWQMIKKVPQVVNSTQAMELLKESFNITPGMRDGATLVDKLGSTVRIKIQDFKSA